MRTAIAFLLLVLLFSCSSPSNKRAVDVNDLDKVQAEDQQDAPPAPTRDALTATELLELSDCGDLPCIQLYMKDHSADFVHAKKGEFAALHRSVVKDTSGRELVMPLSTLYIETNPQADWRMAHTVHRKETGDQLLDEFKKLGFVLTDSGYYHGRRGLQQLFTSPRYPGKNLYVYATYKPWNMKGLYQQVTWPCYVFEVYAD